jgi:hypothetical protein
MRLIILFLSVFCSLTLYGGEERRGTYGAAFLKIGLGARAAGMGGAFTAVADDGSAIYWNPAGLAQLKKREILAVHTRMFEEIEYEYLAYIHPLRKVCIGVGIGYLHIGGIERRGSGDELLGYFEARDMGLTFAIASKMKDLLFGVSLKGIRQEIDLEMGDGYGVDAGIIYKGFDPRISLGAYIRNIGTIGWGKKTHQLPVDVGFGASHSFLRGRFIIASDIRLQADNRTRSHFGLEWRPFAMRMRCGYRSGYGRVGLEAATFGVGFHHTRKVLISYDYAWVGYGTLGQVHRFSINLKF